MTLGIIALDGLDWNLAKRFDVFQNVPDATGFEPLTNDLDGENALFTPRVWTSIAVGDDQDVVTGWERPDAWEEAIATEGYTPIWDLVAGARVVNWNAHTGYINRSDAVPDGWTPTHGSPEQIRETTVDVAQFWNRTLERNPPLLLGYWRAPDALGHNQVGEEYGHEEIYPFLRDVFFPQLIDWPDDWLIVSDHGFANRDEDIPGGPKSGRGKKAHTPDAVLGSNFGIEDDFDGMKSFIDGWTDEILGLIRRRNLESLGYQV